MLLHTCSPPRDEGTEAQTLWVCPQCGAVWEAAPDEGGIFDFDRNDIITRAAWIRVESGVLAG